MMQDMITSPKSGPRDPLVPAWLEELERNTIQFARDAGAILVSHFQTALNIEYKQGGSRDPVTEVDKASEQLLWDAIRSTYPTHSILGEEGADFIGDEPDFLWALDPLDGTVNYINGLPFFACSVGVLYKGEPIAGAIFMPASGFLQQGVFHARQGAPSFFDDFPIAVAPQPLPQPSRISGLPSGWPRMIKFSGPLQRTPGDVRSLGSIAVEMALTACSTMQYAVFNRAKLWDVAAGTLIVKQAGGLALTQDARNKPWYPVQRFTPPKGEGPEGYRAWSNAMIVGNPEMAWAVANNLHRPLRIMRSVQQFVNNIKPGGR